MDQRPVNEIKVAKLMESPSSGEEKSSQISNISFLILCNPICKSLSRYPELLYTLCKNKPKNDIIIGYFKNKIFSGYHTSISKFVKAVNFQHLIPASYK